jgi:alkaline phosphatase D
VRFILTDNYSYRSPAADPDGADKTMLGDEQQAWFEQELLAAKGRYPVIVWVNSQPWIVDAADNADGWGAYATERQEIANFINDYEIQGLMSLSGDAHMLAIDDGSHNLFGTEQVPGFPVFQAAALDRRGTEKGGPYSEGAYPGGGQFGLMTVNDNGGEEIEIIWSGRNYDDEEIIGYTFTVPATPVQSAEKEPAASAWAPQALAPSPFHSGGRRKRRPS